MPLRLDASAPGFEKDFSSFLGRNRDTDENVDRIVADIVADSLSTNEDTAITANLGVNPSLTITAQAERAFSMWPNAGDADPRPAQGYTPVAPVPPRSPA